MKRRADFVLAGKGVRVHCGLFTLQKGRPRTGDAIVTPEPRIGFTVTKKVGNAVERNRIRRRLREAVRLSAALPTEPQTDYVVVARREALTVPFGQLMADLETTMRRSVGRSAARGSARDRRGTVT